jgi:hypothetical protein
MAINPEASPTHEAPYRGLRVLDFGQTRDGWMMVTLVNEPLPIRGLRISPAPCVRPVVRRRYHER